MYRSCRWGTGGAVTSMVVEGGASTECVLFYLYCAHLPVQMPCIMAVLFLTFIGGSVHEILRNGNFDPPEITELIFVLINF